MSMLTLSLLLCACRPTDVKSLYRYIIHMVVCMFRRQVLRISPKPCLSTLILSYDCYSDLLIHQLVEHALISS